MFAVLIGIGLAINSIAVQRWLALDGKTYYVTLTIVIASYYPLFAIMGGQTSTMLIESAVMMLFVTAAMIGCRHGYALFVGLALIGHGAYDLVHHYYLTNEGMPGWWPRFCAAADLVLGSWILYESKASVSVISVESSK